MTSNHEKVAVVIPYYKQQLTADEQISMDYVKRFLSAYPRIVIAPEGLTINQAGFQIIRLPSQYFSNTRAYSNLLLSPEFYETFVYYDYILIYQLDCLVFSNDLYSWCELGYDYIGAPLFEKGSQPPRLSRVGNGGLSLRRVQVFLDILCSTHIPAWSEAVTDSLPDLRPLKVPARWLKRLRVIHDARRGIEWYRSNYRLNEDLFWSDRARLFNHSFKVAPLDIALRFAFDAQPRVCFEKNDKELPFGVHAWSRWDREFWEPYLLQ